ncbi:hypothetical protein F5X99DRAFT_379924 [Biscogniauxia marginata]|nr:hypothetical protein F5X99DRAFT_379924 [Biscogniauxia marginata]
MSLWPCDWDKCRQPAVQRAGDCFLCDRHLCRTHLQDQWHKCPKPEESWEDYSAQYAATEARQMNELCRRIDGSKLCTRASLLRRGIPCTINLSTKKLSTMMGGQNCHAEITFQDNVKWLARFRLAKTSSPPVEARDYILRSEAATMNFLRKHTRIPTPEVFDWACESDPQNPLGEVGYILMEKVEGEPLDWQLATSSQKERVMQQLVDIFLEIEKHPFDAIGSITPAKDPTAFEIQGFAHHSTFRPECGGALGPFYSSLEAARVVVESCLAMIASGEIAATYPIDVYLVHRFRLDILNNVGKEILSEGKFFLKHPDDKGDHILINKAYDIVSIIDWEWCHTVSKEDAFSSPCMMWPVAEFYDGSNELANDELRFASIFRERGRDDIASYVTEGRKVQRFFFALGAASGCQNNYQTFVDLFIGLKRVFDSEEGGWEEWKTKALEKWKSDHLLQALLQSET